MMNKRLVFPIAVVAASAGGYLAMRGLRTGPASSASPALATLFDLSTVNR
jgi:hypothetical protein